MPIYAAASAGAAHDALEAFETGPLAAVPDVAQSWRRAWEHVIPLFGFPPDVGREI